jgi:valyl-tRNA synthetase
MHRLGRAFLWKSVVVRRYGAEVAGGMGRDVPMASAYCAPDVERGWEAHWQSILASDASDASDARSRAAGEGPFSMVLPPPNVTGVLHMGHALTAAVEDALVRWQRMRGRAVRWAPGTDHAGIATQVVVERQLRAARSAAFPRGGATRHDIGRDAFVQAVWRWTDAHSGAIGRQLRRLGCALDWRADLFTMDPRYASAVVDAFVRLHEMGAVRRDARLVHWDCALRTAISDVEVEMLQLDAPTELPAAGHPAGKRYKFGYMTDVAYPVDGGAPGDEVVVSTTRVETLLGDVAVAVHPDDPRYARWHGRRLRHPVLGTLIPIVLDPVLVDMSLGTGAVKVTPGHDFNDFECGRRHGLSLVSVLDDAGCVALPGDFLGLPRYEARERILERLRADGFLRGERPHAHALPLCSRTKEVLEPRSVPQWYVDVSAAALRALDDAAQGRLRFVPERYGRQWEQWLGNIQPWCVSRQLWWGHRIPMYRVVVHGTPLDEADPAAWVCARSDDDALAKARAAVPHAAPLDVSVAQDEDVLDTWFSSALFPLVSNGWPGPDAGRAWTPPDTYPLSVMETGEDILFFWVARMVLMSRMLDNSLPFGTVLLHPMVRDASGQKMSKSLGNVLDPIDVIEGRPLLELQDRLRGAEGMAATEIDKGVRATARNFPAGIPECGTDALRFTLSAYLSQTSGINFDVQRCLSNRHFCNKLWNTVRFARMHAGCAADGVERAVPAVVLPNLSTGAARRWSSADIAELGLAERWIVGRLDSLSRAMDRSMRAYDLSAAAHAFYRFWMGELCDIYVELAKGRLRSASGADRDRVVGTLIGVMESGLRLLHPLMPFVSEDLYHRLPLSAAPASLLVAEYPTSVLADAGAEAMCARAAAEMDEASELAHGVRGLRSSLGLKPSAAPALSLVASSPGVDLAADQLEALRVLAGAGSVELLPSGALEPMLAAHAHASVVVSERYTALLPTSGVDAAAELAKLDKRAARARGAIEQLRRREQADGYVERCPPEVRAETSARLAALDEELAACARARDILQCLN